MIIKTIFFLSVLLLHVNLKAQSLIGLWEVKEVKVGKEKMTPVAKWTRINEDGTYQSGNGWLQNSAGKWNYDETNRKLKLSDSRGIKDEFGPFEVSFNNSMMIWEREEEGKKVVVSQSEINSLPKSPADMIVGLWELKKVISSAESENNPDEKHIIFFRWDRIFTVRGDDGERDSGFWHMNAHRPELSFFSDKPGSPTERWNVSVNDSLLTITGLSESNSAFEIEYHRINKFPY